jgi:hypothetical protein
MSHPTNSGIPIIAIRKSGNLTTSHPDPHISVPMILDPSPFELVFVHPETSGESLFAGEYKRAKTEGKKCHTKTMVEKPIPFF